MTPLCRYILPAGRYCEQPAVRGTHFCRHHGEVKRVTRRPPRKRYDFTYIIPFVYAEDRTGIQFNLHLVTQALAEGKIDVRTANAYTNNIRAAATNLRQGSLVEPDRNNTVKRVILTPEGDEIAPPREVLEKNESPIHYKDCPCRSCAEQFRGAPPEQHHTDCKCGLCEETSEPRSALSDQNDAKLSTQECHPERSATEERGVEGPAVSEPATAVDGNHQSQLAILSPEPSALSPVRKASAHALRSAETLDPIQKIPNYDDYIYGDEISKHEAQHAARTRAALEAGLDFDALHLGEMRDGAKRGCLDGQSHPDQPKEFKPYLTWGEEQDLKLAEMKRLREQEGSTTTRTSGVCFLEMGETSALPTKRKLQSRNCRIADKTALPNQERAVPDDDR